MEVKLLTGLKMVLSILVCGIALAFVYLYNVLALAPRRVRSKLQSQGIKGPYPAFLYGNIPEIKKIQLQIRSCGKTTPKCHPHEGEGRVLAHNWPTLLFPHLEQWRNEYGSIFMYSTGNILMLCITDPEMVKVISLCTSLNLGKPSYLSKDRGPLLGQGILSSNGVYWIHQKKIIAPEFYLEKVKEMVNLMVQSTTSMLQSWEIKIKNRGGNADIRVDEDLRNLSADIISRACFGSSYSQGENIFLKLRTLQKVMSRGHIGVPGLRFLPSKQNREIWRLEKEIHSAIIKLVEARRASTNEKDLLQLILEAAVTYEDNEDLRVDTTANKFIVDNCKSLYFAGHETTATSASWCLVLLAAYPDWQARARAEVLKVCGDKLPDADMLRKMKVLTMVIQEALRLYPPVAYVVREALHDIRLKDIQVPKGTNIQILIPMLHQEPDLWGPDANQFNPERFAEGPSRACKIPQAYMPFGVGARTCIGQHFAIAELKVILALILSSFSFALSPAYQHSPDFRLVIEPEHGVVLNIKRV